MVAFLSLQFLGLWPFKLGIVGNRESILESERFIGWKSNPILNQKLIKKARLFQDGHIQLI